MFQILTRLFGTEPGSPRGVAPQERPRARQARADRGLLEDDARLRLAAIVESSDDAIMSSDLAGVITSWNKGAERLYGYTAEEMVGKSLSTLSPPDHKDEVLRIMQRIARGEYIEHFETQRLRKDGSRVDVSLTVSPVHDDNGRIIGVSKIARDISDRKRMEAELRTEDRRKTEFLAVLAHELRNPLAGIRNGLQVMQLAAHDRQATTQARTLMERQLHHLVRLVDDLLDISRINRGKVHLQKERITLATVVAHTLELCDQVVKLHQHELTVTVPDEPIYVDADKTRLSQALCNLLNNAAKYTEQGGRIWITVRRQGHEAAISVKDTGVGIPPDMLPQVFELFTQVDRTLERAQGGLGVGLTIVKRLVEMHGGMIEAHSEGRGLGSEFIIRLPVALSVVEVQPDEADEPLRPGRIARHRILVVDDNADAAASLAMMLKFTGNEVRTAHDGVEAMGAATAFLPDVILLDIGMPRLNGYDTCRKMRAQPWGQGAAIVALTGWGQDEDKRRAAEAGFDSHMVKPIDPRALESLLDRLKCQTA